MKIFMVGGTGLLGSEAARELIGRGHEVSAIALPPLPNGALLPREMKIDYGNYLEMPDEQLRAHFQGCDGFVFAAGVDERVEGPAPIYDMYKKYNIDALERLLRIAKECGVKHSVICGSYFAYFAKVRTESQLTKWHPYIKSRIDQENMALSFADDGFDVAILELPYIFGTQPGRKPVWSFLVEMIAKMKFFTLYPKGGTTMVTVKQVAQAVAGAIEKNRGGNCYPIGYYNMTWKQMLDIIHKHMGMAGRKVITIPDWMYKMGGMKIKKQQKAEGIDGGLDMVKFTELQCSNLFIDKSMGCDPLGVGEDDIGSAIGDSIVLCLDILNGNGDVIGMRGE